MRRSKKEKKLVTGKYAELMHSVANDDYYKVALDNRTNTYTCSNGHITKTVDVDPGCTPFMHSCSECDEISRSSFYSDTHPEMKPTQEWHRPSLEECLKLSEGMLEHVLSGGLVNRDIGE